MAGQNRPQLFDVLPEHDPELYPPGKALPPVSRGVECSQAALELGNVVYEILERSLAGECGGSDGCELEELIFRRPEGLELAQSPFESLEFDQEGLVLWGCLTILWIDFNRMSSPNSEEAILIGV